MVKLAFRIHPRPALASAVLAALLVLTTRSAAAAPGDLDPSFGIGGRVTTDFGKDEPDRGHAVVIQSDGKIIIAGQGEDRGDWDVAALARYNPDGSLDTLFDGDGLVTTEFEEDSGINAVAIQPDGKIVAAGFTDDGDDQFAVARYLANGELEWEVTTNFDDENGWDDEANAVAIQPDGKIVVAGITDAGVRGANFALARYNAGGSLDTAFGGDGKVTTDFAEAFYGANSVAIQVDGKIVVAGFASTFASNGNGDVAVARYNPDGSLDSSFGPGGLVTTDLGGSEGGNELTIQADGKLVVAASTNTGNWDFAVLRYNADGTLDPSFGNGGHVTTDFGGNDGGHGGMVIQADGKIVVAGDTSVGDGDFAAARYNLDGSLDSTFGTGGRVTTDFGGGDRGEGMAMQADGRIVVAGTSHRQPRNVDFALARYLGGSAAPTATPSVAPPIPTASPTAPSPTATLTVCPGVAGRVPRAALDQAISLPDRVDGWDLLCHVSQAPSWWNHLRRSLTLRSNSRLFHPLFNPLVFKCGCG